MKQGQASSSGMGSTKREPRAHAVSETYANQLGEHVGKASNARNMYEGRGFTAPMAGSDTHQCGSQGKHK